MSLKFRSGYEKRIWENAIAWQFSKPGRKKLVEYEPQDSHLHYVVPRFYIPDFRLGNGVLVEAKGRFTSADRTKMLLVKKHNPLADIRLLFQRANMKLTKSKNSMTYWQWAERHGFIWAEGETIPSEWYK